MKICILDTDATKCAQALDDKSLDKQIKAIAQVLCSVHHIIVERIELGLDFGTIYEIPLPYKKYKSFESIAQYRYWASECIANYEYLVKLANCCLMEYYYRKYPLIFFHVPDEIIYFQHPKHKLHSVIEWARDNVPDLPYFIGDFEKTWHQGDVTPFPLVVPKKYWINDGYGNEGNIIESYCNYYAAKIKCKKCEGEGHIHCSSNVGEWVSECNCDCGINATWTRREKPEWLTI